VSELARFMGKPGLARLWALAAERIERLGGVRGTIVLADATAEERRAIADLLGMRQEPDGLVRIPLGRLDAALRGSRLGVGLGEAVTTRHGTLRNRPAERAAAVRDWEEAIAAVAADPVVTARPALQRWLNDVVRAGLLRRLAKDDPGELLRAALAVLAVVPLGESELLPRVAARLAEHSHALDHGTPLATLVLRGIAALLDRPVPTTALDRRALWEAAGIVCDNLSCDVLVCNLAAEGDSLTARFLRDFAAAGEPVRLTLRQLTGADLRLPAGVCVYAVENPAVVSAASLAFGYRCPPMVCVDGVPTTAARRLLRTIAAAGRVLYHGDFDWAGVRIGNLLHAELHFEPWRFSAEDYLTAVAGAGVFPPLEGPAVEARWDERLAPAMASAGCAVQEEHVLNSLLSDLDRG